MPEGFLVLNPNFPNIPSVSLFGPAVKYKALVDALSLPFPKTSAHKPSTFSGLPSLPYARYIPDARPPVYCVKYGLVGRLFAVATRFLAKISRSK